MLRKCEEDVGFCPSTVWQLLWSRETKEVVLHFVTVTRVGTENVGGGGGRAEEAE